MLNFSFYVIFQIITKATTDGTLYSRDWDTEPLFQLPDTSLVNNECVSSLASLLFNFKHCLRFCHRLDFMIAMANGTKKDMSYLDLHKHMIVHRIKRREVYLWLINRNWNLGLCIWSHLFGIKLMLCSLHSLVVCLDRLFI